MQEQKEKKSAVELTLLTTELYIVEQKLQDFITNNPEVYKNKKLKLAIKESFIYISRINTIVQSKYSLGDADTKNMLAYYLEQFGYLLIGSKPEEMEKALDYYITLLEKRESDSNPEAPETLVKLKQYALKLTRNDDKAEDLVSETITRILEKQDLYKHDLYFSTWCTNIMYNLFVDNHRKENNRGKYFIVYKDNVDDVEGDENDGIWKVELEEIYECIDMLKESEKKLVLRRLEEKMSFKELGELYKLEPNSIRYKYYIVIKKLRAIMVKRNPDLATINKHLKQRKQPPL